MNIERYGWRRCRQRAHRARRCRRHRVSVVATATGDTGRALRPRQEPAQAGAAQVAGRLDGALRPSRPGGTDQRQPPGQGRPADPDPGRPDDRLAVRIPARHRGRDGRGRRPAAVQRDHPGDLRRRAPGQLRFLRLARARPGDRPQRLRRGPPGRLGVGPAPAGRQHLGRRAAERRLRGAVRQRRCGPVSPPTAKSCGGWPTSRCSRGPSTGWTSTGWPPRRAGPLQRRGGAVGQAGAAPHQRPGAAAVHPRGGRRAEDRRGAAADHPAARNARRSCWPRRSTSTWTPCRRTGGGCSAATRWSTSRTRSSASAASGCAPTWRCWRAASADDVVFLQLKQARRSVLARYVHGDSAWHAHQGQRVVEYQQALQTVSDPLLGWTTMDGLQYYVRQFRNMKGTHPARRDRRGRAGRLRRSGGSAAGQGARPDQRRLDDRRVHGQLRPGRQGAVHSSPGATPTRPKPTTPRWSAPSTADCCPSSAGYSPNN